MSKDKPADHDKTNRVFTTLREGPNGREGLVGAAPVGNRWRAQGFISGSVRYLGTFDTEREAHDAYIAAKTAEKDAKLAADAEWLASAPLYVYEGGVGRGARLNGRHFKLVNDELPQHLIVREMSDDGSEYGNPVTLNRKYLRLIEVAVEAQAPADPDGEQPQPQDLAVEVPPDTDVDAFEAALKVMAALGDDSELADLPPAVAAAIVKAREHLREGTRESREAKAARDNLKHEVVDAVFGTRSRSLGDKDRVLKWLLTKVRHGNSMDYPPAVVALRMVQGTVSHDRAVNFLKEHTDIDHGVLDEVLGETVGKLFDPGIDPELVSRLQSGKRL